MCLSRGDKTAVRMKTEEVYLNTECGLSWRPSPENSFYFRSEQIFEYRQLSDERLVVSLGLKFTRQQPRSNTCPLRLELVVRHHLSERLISCGWISPRLTGWISHPNRQILVTGPSGLDDMASRPVKNLVLQKQIYQTIGQA